MAYSNTTFYHGAGSKITETTYRYQGLEDSDSDDDSGSKSTINSKYWRNAIKAAKRAEKKFDLYPWDDNPRDLKGDEATRRVEWLSRQRGYPFDDFSKTSSDGYTYHVSPGNAIQLLYLCHKVKNHESFNKDYFCKEIGEARELRANVQECCILF